MCIYLYNTHYHSWYDDSTLIRRRLCAATMQVVAVGAYCCVCVYIILLYYIRHERGQRPNGDETMRNRRRPITCVGCESIRTPTVAEALTLYAASTRWIALYTHVARRAAFVNSQTVFYTFFFFFNFAS